MYDQALLCLIRHFSPHLWFVLVHKCCIVFKFNVLGGPNVGKKVSWCGYIPCFVDWFFSISCFEFDLGFRFCVLHCLDAGNVLILLWRSETFAMLYQILGMYLNPVISWSHKLCGCQFSDFPLFNFYLLAKLVLRVLLQCGYIIIKGRLFVLLKNVFVLYHLLLVLSPFNWGVNVNRPIYFGCVNGNLSLLLF